MSKGFTFGFLDDECVSNKDEKQTSNDDHGENFLLTTAHEEPAASDVRDSDATLMGEKKPFLFRPMVDVELLLTDLVSRDLQIEYVRLPNPSIEPLLQIQLIHDVNFQKEPLTITENCNQEHVPCNNGVDLIPGVYEGGATVWECSKDLLHFMILQKDELLQKRHVLELGCGHALPSCWWLRERLSLQSELSAAAEEQQNETDFCVLCSDFNDFVIDKIVLSNISVNSRLYEPTKVARHVAVGAGDWMDMSRQLLHSTGNDETLPTLPQCLPLDGKFDLILAAETTYTEEAARDTARLLRRHLKVDTGIALVATKRYYFGVGGGAHAFRQYAMESTSLEDPSTAILDLIVSTLQVYDNGVGNIRELLQVQCVQRSTSE